MSLRNGCRCFLAACCLIACVAGCETAATTDVPAEAERETAKPTQFTVDGSVEALAFSPDGRTLAVAAEGVHIWDLTSVTEIGSVRQGIDTQLEFSPDGQFLVSKEDRHTVFDPRWTIHFWQVLPDKEWHGVWSTACESRNPTEACHFTFSPDGKTLALADPGGIVRLWECTTGNEQLRFEGGVAVTYTDDGKVLLGVTHDGAVQRFEAATGKPATEKLRGRNQDYIYVENVAFAVAGNRLGVTDGLTVLLKDPRNGDTLSRIEVSERVSALHLIPDGSALIVITRERIGFFDGTTGQLRGWLYPRNAEVGAIAVSEDGTLFAWTENTFAEHRWRSTIHVCPTASISTAGPRPPPSAGPLQIELAAKPGTHALDLGGRTADEFSREAVFGQRPPSPKVDLEFRIRNISDEPVTFQNPERLPLEFYVTGPGALNVPRGPYQTGFDRRDPDPLVTLKPGGSLTRSVTAIDCGDSYPFWLLPGEHTIRARWYLSISPPGRQARHVVDGFGWVTLWTRPITVKVTPAR